MLWPMEPVQLTVVGGGLAGCEAAYQAAGLGVEVLLLEMKPLKFSPAHRSAKLAELVCSNSLRAESLENAVGLLKEELKRMNSLIMKAAEATRVPAGGSLAVDREAFSAMITQELEKNPRDEDPKKARWKPSPKGDPVVRSHRTPDRRGSGQRAFRSGWRRGSLLLRCHSPHCGRGNNRHVSVLQRIQIW